MGPHTHQQEHVRAGHLPVPARLRAPLLCKGEPGLFTPTALGSRPDPPTAARGAVEKWCSRSFESSSFSPSDRTPPPAPRPANQDLAGTRLRSHRPPTALPTRPPTKQMPPGTYQGHRPARPPPGPGAPKPGPFSRTPRGIGRRRQPGPGVQPPLASPFKSQAGLAVCIPPSLPKRSPRAHTRQPGRPDHARPPREPSVRPSPAPRTPAPISVPTRGRRHPLPPEPPSASPSVPAGPPPSSPDPSSPKPPESVPHVASPAGTRLPLSASAAPPVRSPPPRPGLCSFLRRCGRPAPSSARNRLPRFFPRTRRPPGSSRRGTDS